MYVGKRLVDILDKYLRFSKEDKDAVHQLISGIEDKPKATGVSVRNVITEVRTGNVIIDYTNGVTLVNPDTGKRTIFLDPDGDAYFGSNIESPATTSLVILSNANFYNGESFGAGDVMLGDNSAGKANMLWDASMGRLRFRGGTTCYVYIDTDGSIVAHQGSIGGWSITTTQIKKDTIVLDSFSDKITVATNKVVLDTSGITAIAGSIGGWSITSDYIYKSAIVLDSQNDKITVATDKVVLDSAGITAIAGLIGGWTINSTEIKKTGIVLDSANDKILVGSGIALYGGSQSIVVGAATPQIVIQGSEKRIYSDNFASGVSGFCIWADQGEAEFENIRARGAIRSSVFEYGDIQATAGTLLVSKSAANMRTDWTSPASIDSSNLIGIENDLQGTPLFAISDILRIKHFTSTGVAQVWLEVTGVSDQGDWTAYTVKLKSGDTSTVFRAGTAVADYGQANDGLIYLSADGVIGSSANISVVDHAGAPWSGQNLRVRIGNLNGSYGITENDYGIGIGDWYNYNYLRYTKNQGFRVQSMGGRWYLDATGMNYTDGVSKWLAIWDSSGLFRFGGDITAGASGVSIAIIGSAQTYNSESFGAGDVLFGDNSANQANMLWDRSNGQLLFRSGQTLHAYVDTDGAIKAGTGNVLLNSNGITIKADTVYHDTRTLKFVDPSSNVFSHLSGRYGISTTWVYTYLINEGNATYPDSFVYISSQPNTENDDAEMLLSAGLYGPCNITLKNLYGSPKEIKLSAEKGIIDVADYGLTVYAGNSSVYFSAPTFQVSGYDGQVNFQLDRPAGSYGFLELQTASSPRWRLAINTTAESGSNAGSDFNLFRYSDAGGYLGSPISVIRSSGLIMLQGDALNAQVTIGGGSAQCSQLHIGSASGYKSQLLFINGGNLAAVWETDTNNDLVWQRYNPPGTFADTGLTLDSSSGDIYTVPWTEYTISTVYGWSSYTVKKIYYKKIGKWLYVYFYISGQAHASDTSASFTFPYNPTSTQSFVQPIRVVDGGTYKFGLLRVTGGSGTCNLYTSAAEGAWATSGLKDAQGWFLIQSP